MEEWKNVKGYDGYYQVSNYGRVWSNKTNKIMRHHRDNKSGYCRLILRKDGKSIGHTIHRLVAEAFIVNQYNKPHINHLDENKENNRTDNLEWCTRLENEHWGTKRERCLKHTDYKAIAEKNMKPINQYSLDGTLIKEWRTAQECKKEYGYDNSHIAKCCNGKEMTAYGYVWKYVKVAV